MIQGSQSRVRCSILGPLEVRVGDEAVRISAAKERLLLALLLCRVNQAVGSGQLIDALWGTEPPRTARKNLQVYLSALRRKVGNRITFQGWGYSFHATPEELDVLAFRKLAEAGRTAMRGGDTDRAATVLSGAIRLWRDHPLVEFADVAMIAEPARKLTELYLSVYEDWAELEIEGGRPVETLRHLDDLVTHYPGRERIVAARMTALVRCGRVAEALSQYDALRLHLAAELGVDPSPPIRSLYHEILAGAGPAPAPAPVSIPAAGRVKRAGEARRPTNQLPRDIIDFVGRDREIRQILPAHAAVTLITGEPGVGKTTLAVHVAHRLAASFDDGVLLVTLRRDGGEQVSPSDTQRALLRAAGVDVTGVPDDTILATLWRAWLADQKLLLVLDDAPDEESVRRFLPGSPSSRVLVTSRSWLSGLDSLVRVRLGGLSEAEARQFLGELLGPERVAREEAAAELILRRCGRLPLPLRLLGGRLAALPHLPLADLASRLGPAGRLFDQLTAGDLSVLPRYEQWHRDLSPAHREVLRTLGGFDQPRFSHADLVAAVGDDAGAAQRIVELALESNIAVLAPGTGTPGSIQFAMSPLMHRFATGLSAADQERSGSAAVSSTLRGRTAYA